MTRGDVALVVGTSLGTRAALAETTAPFPLIGTRVWR